MKTLQEISTENYKKTIISTFNLIASLVIGFNNKFSCNSKKFNSFYSIPEGAKLIIDQLPDCLISFETFTHKEDLKELNQYSDRFNNPKITVTESIIVVFEQTTFVLPNNSETIKELANKMAGKSSKLTEVYNVEPMEIEIEKPKHFLYVCTLNKEVIKQVKTASNFTANDELMPAMECIYFDSENIVASDAHKLFCEPHNLNVKKSFMVPKNGVKFIKKSKTDVEVYRHENTLSLKTGTDFILCEMPENQYPNYKSVMPKNKPYSVTIDRNNLIDEIKKQSIYANQASGLVKLDFKNENYCLISGQDIDFSISAQSRLNCSGDFINEIGFKGSFLITALLACKNDEVTIKFSDPMIPNKSVYWINNS
jgi:hypothetical protein